MTAYDVGHLRVVVAGIGVSGVPVAEALHQRGATVLVVDGREGDREQDVARRLRAAGIDVRLGDAESPVDADLVVTSPGWRPDQPLLSAAAREGVEVIGEPELAWRLQPHAPAAGGPAWLGVTGTNGKTTTTGMLESILTAAGHRTVAAGNVGLPLVTAALAEPSYDVLAVEMSSFQLHWSSTIRFTAGAVLNVAEDHLDWHGSMAAYAADKAKIWGPPEAPAYVLYNDDDDWARRLAEPYADRQAFTLGPPSRGTIGVEDGMIVAHLDTRRSLLPVSELQVPGPHNLANALAAAGLALQWGFTGATVPDEAIAAGLRAFRPGRHRNELVAARDGVSFVDDSKATNPHAAAASLQSYSSVVWIAGGLLKGAEVDDLVASEAHRLHGVVLIGRDRAVLAQALARHAPDVPVHEVADADTGAMDVAVRLAAGVAVPGDVVLLAPAAASMDMFRDYAERGDRFAAAARAITGEADPA